MADLAALTASKDALLKALGNGTLTVSAAGVTRTFRSIAEIQQAIAAVDAQIRAAGGGAPRISQVQINSGPRGW